MNYQDITEFDTKLTADVVEWRHQEKNNSSDILACGTYFLNKEKNKRLGCIYLLDLDKESSNLRMLDCLNFDDSGILDMKWLNTNKLITIDSNNDLRLISFDESVLACVDTLSLNAKHSDAIGLTFDFKTNQILTSDTKGFVSLIRLDTKLELNQNFKAHDYEIWSVMLDRFDENVFYSGADDCILKTWDIRNPIKSATECSLFQGGVVSIISPAYYQLNTYNENHLICGSYDETIRVLDKRNLKRSINESKKLNGGVWKIKPNKNRNLLLCACMHTGAHLINATTLESELYYDKHGLDNLVYGCDWKCNEIVATCSFYNHNLRVCKIILTKRNKKKKNNQNLSFKSNNKIFSIFYIFFFCCSKTKVRKKE